MFFSEENIRTELLPELVELAGDEENSVQLATFDTIINLMEMIDGSECRMKAVFAEQIPVEHLQMPLFFFFRGPASCHGSYGDGGMQFRSTGG